MIESGKSYRCGYAAIIGRPNVGKSTILNKLIRQKISITSRRPQTTRHTILGVHTLPDSQIIYVDTPGIHFDYNKAMNRYMNRLALRILEDVDAILLVVEALQWTKLDQDIVNLIGKLSKPVILAANKVDLIKEKEKLLPWLADVSGKADFTEVVPISAVRDDQLDVLEKELIGLLPEGQMLFPEDQLTDRSERFLAAEIVREKLTRSMGNELPYTLAVEIEQFDTGKKITNIGAIVWVEREGQKAIIIGKGGDRLKRVGRSAREDIEKLLGRKVYLQVWVKVKAGWSNDERALRSLGYHDPI